MKCSTVALLIAVVLFIASKPMSDSFTPPTTATTMINQSFQSQKYHPIKRGIPGRRESGATR